MAWRPGGATLNGTAPEQARAVLHAVLNRLRSICDEPVTLLDDAADRLLLQIGRDTRAQLGLSVHDPVRPTFAISYPSLSVRRNGDRVIQVAGANNVLLEGVEWAAKQLAQHGVVRPEFE
jgi:hypothetical protein